MSINEFTALCEKYLVGPAIALENEELRRALKAKNAALVEEILKSEF